MSGLTDEGAFTAFNPLGLALDLDRISAIPHSCIDLREQSRNCGWAVKVGRHHRQEITAMPPAIGLAQFDAGDLGDRIPFIVGSSGPVSKELFRHRPRR